MIFAEHSYSETPSSSPSFPPSFSPPPFFPPSFSPSSFSSQYSYDLSSQLVGGIASCSTQDLKNWYFEGFVFLYNNITDMVYGSDSKFVLQRPTVIYNKKSSQYVLWATMESTNTTSLFENTTSFSQNTPSAPLFTRMSVVLYSPYSDGPFLLSRSFYPDGNRTSDQIVFISENNVPLLIRTYYQTIEYLLPKTIMQPIWESVKFRNGSTNFRNNYHRTNYDVNYDNKLDTFDQIWRKENVPWEIKCVNKITGVSTTKYLNDTYKTSSDNSLNSICTLPDEMKITVGTGQPAIESRFVDPSNPGPSYDNVLFLVCSFYVLSYLILFHFILTYVILSDCCECFTEITNENSDELELECLVLLNAVCQQISRG